MSAGLPEPEEEGEHLTLVSLKGDPNFLGFSKQGEPDTWP